MINFKKGPALSLHQVNYIGNSKSGEGVVAGMVVTINGSGQVVKPTIAGSAADKALLLGFAINNQDSGDVLESGVIGVYALDGASVIETDQATGTINAGTYPVGSLLKVDTGTGKVTPAANDYAYRVIGQVEGIRTLPGNIQSLTDNNGNTVKVQGTTTVLAIKLLS